MITADEAKVFDLVGNQSHLEIFDKMCLIVANKYNNTNNKNIDSKFMASAIELLKEKNEFDVVRAFFEMKDKNFKNINKARNIFPMRMGRIQICVINTNCISDCNVIED